MKKDPAAACSLQPCAPLPVDVVASILRFCSFETVFLHAALVSRTWHAASRRPDVLGSVQSRYACCPKAVLQWARGMSVSETLARLRLASPLKSSCSLDGMQSFHVYPAYQSFDDMGLPSALLRGIYAYGFEKPSKVQTESIVAMASVRPQDVFLRAQAGTGKTAAFAIALIKRLLEKPGQMGIVIVPTRELAVATTHVIKGLANFVPEIRPMAISGGTVRREQANQIRDEKCNVLVSTPGRLYDLHNRGILDFSCGIAMLVVDEADELFSRGSSDLVKDLMHEISRDKIAQLCVFSSTCDPTLAEFCATFQSEAMRLKLQRDELTLEGVRQYYVNASKEEWKLDTLLELLEMINATGSVIYCNTRRHCDWLAEELVQRGVSARSCSGPRDPVHREFREGQFRHLITTHLALHSVDVSHVGLVFHWNVPEHLEQYVMHVGRRGRFRSLRLTSVLLMTDEERCRIREIESYYDTSIEELPENFADVI